MRQGRVVGTSTACLHVQPGLSATSTHPVTSTCAASLPLLLLLLLLLCFPPPLPPLQKCDPSDYDFTNAEEQAIWLDCCEAVRNLAKRDLDCEKKQWR